MVQFSQRYWLLLGLMLAAFAANLWLRAPKLAARERYELRRLAPDLPGWRKEEPRLPEQTAQQLKADEILLRNYYDSQNRRVEFFVGYYEDQQFGAQVHSPLHCLPGAGWTILRNDKFQLPFEHMRGAASKLDISKKDDQQIVLYWFVSDGKVVQNEMDLKIRLMVNAFQRRVTSVYFYRVCVAYQESEANAGLALLQEFLNALAPRVGNLNTQSAVKSSHASAPQ